MLRLDWLKQDENVSYVDANTFIPNYAKETGIPDLLRQIIEFVESPVKEGKTIIGTRHTSLRLFIPNLMFDEHIDMGENPWLYSGDMYPAYCIYGLPEKSEG